MTPAIRGDVVAAGAAACLVRRLGAPGAGVVLGSGFASLAPALGAGDPVPFAEIPGWPALHADGHGGGVAGADVAGRRTWFFLGRLHAYEGHTAWEAALPVRVLAAAGARNLLQTCAAGGLREEDRPGDLAVVSDHVNLLGDDPVRRIAAPDRDPAFPDLQDAYDPAWIASWRHAARETGCGLRSGVLAALPGPCYETPAEVRMLRVLGADLVSMSVVPETILARYFGMRVAAVACISNRGAGLGGMDTIRHDNVLDVVGRAVASRRALFAAGIASSLATDAV